MGMRFFKEKLALDRYNKLHDNVQEGWLQHDMDSRQTVFTNDHFYMTTAVNGRINPN